MANGPSSLIHNPMYNDNILLHIIVHSIGENQGNPTILNNFISAREVTLDKNSILP